MPTVIEPDPGLVMWLGQNPDADPGCTDGRHRMRGDIGYPPPGTDLLTYRGPMAVTEICDHEPCVRRAASWVAAVTGQQATFATFAETGRGGGRS